MPNFLQQLKQGGALDIASPAKAYKNALAVQGLKGGIEETKLSSEGKRVLLGKEAMKNTQGLEGYPKTLDYMVDKLGISRDDLPSYESFGGDPKKFSEFQKDWVSSGSEWLKAQKGQKHKVTIIYPNGRQSNVEMDSEQAEAYMKKFPGVKIIPGTVSEKTRKLIEQQAESVARGKRLGEGEKAPSAFAEKRKALKEEFPKATREERLEALYDIKPGEGDEKADRIWVTKGNRKKQVRQYSKEHLDAVKGGWAEGQPISTARPPAGQTYRLSDGTRVRSFDGGRTYTDETGKKRPLPTDAFPMEVEITMQDIRMEEAQKEAVRKMGAVQERAELPTAEEAARGGTGPFAKLAAAIDAVAGGLNIDLIFGKEGLFQDTQENRQLLRTIKQMGKSALMNSSRGAIWEQEKIEMLFPDPDKIWRNPRTEARKFTVLRETLLTERNFNLEAIASAVSPKEVDKLRGSNLEIDRLLALIKPAEEPAGPSGLTQEDEDLIKKYLR